MGAFLTENKALLHEYSVHMASSKDNVGLKPLLREKTIVGYDNLFDQVVNNENRLDVFKLIHNSAKAEIGVYDLSDCTTKWISNEQFDQESLFIKAACTLPMFGRKVRINGKDYLDGGITTMIPIGRSVNNANERHLVITTKPDNYIRKPYNPLVIALFKLVYHQYPKLAADMQVRHEAYYREIQQIRELEVRKQAMHIFPSQDIGVTRFSGSHEQLTALFDLGYADMEAKKELIIEFLKGED